MVGAQPPKCRQSGQNISFADGIGHGGENTHDWNDGQEVNQWWARALGPWCWAGLVRLGRLANRALVLRDPN